MRKPSTVAGLLLVATLSLPFSPAMSPAFARQGADPTMRQAPVSGAAMKVLREDDLAAITRTRARWLRALNRGDVSGLLDVYGAGAVLLPEGAAPLLGAAGILDWHGRWSPAVLVRYELVEARLVRVDDLFVLEEWSAHVTVRRRAQDLLAIDGDVLQFRQGGVRVYRRAPGSGWRIDRETWSQEPPALVGYARGGISGCVPRIC